MEHMKEFFTNLAAAATIAAICTVGLLAGGAVEAAYTSLSVAVHLTPPPADMRGVITALVAVITVVGSGMAYMERR